MKTNKEIFYRFARTRFSRARVHGVNEASMNHGCPHCNELTISYWQKINSETLLLGTCSCCKGLS